MKMNKCNFIKILLGLALLLTVNCALLTSSVSAHILLTDGSIGAVVHISPEDDPIVGQNADFFFEFKDKTNSFNPQNCDCRYHVLLNEKKIASGNLFGGDVEPSLDNASFSLVFPEKGIYTLLINGKPFTPGEFDEFTLKETVRIERTPESPSETKIKTNFFTTHYLFLKVFGVGLVIFLVLLFIKIIKNR